jgi:predicted nucleic acid-binding protein
MKTYVFDASALFIYLQKKPSANRVNELLKQALDGRVDVLMSVINFGEVYRIILRDHVKERALAVMSALQSLPIRLIDATQARAFYVAEVKSTCRLYYIDSFAAALAIEHNATLVTSDSDFRKMGHTFPILWLKA